MRVRTIGGWRPGCWIGHGAGPLFVGLVTLLLIGSGADAVEPVAQLTKAEAGCYYLTPRLSGDGRWVGALATCPADSGEGSHHQIVRIERASGQAQVLTPPGSFALSPRLSSDGRRIVFVSTAELVAGQNPDHILQVFLFDALTGRYTQVTHFRLQEVNHAVDLPDISGNGNTVVFASTGDLVTGHNKDGNYELFSFDVAADRLFQVTQTEVPAQHRGPVVSQDGQVVVFVGIHPPFSRRPHTGLYEWRAETGEVRRLIEPPLQDIGAFERAVLAGQGHRVAFISRFDLLGENPDRNTELFLLEVATGMVRQLTHTRGCANEYPTLSADGTLLLFVSACRFGQLNPLMDSNVFLMRLDNGEVIQMTDSGAEAPIEPPTIDQSGRLAAVSIGAELKGMANPKRLLQVALLALPRLEPAPEAPIRFVAAAEVSVLLVSRHDPDTLYLASRRAGVMKSEDNGRFWRLFSFALPTVSVTCLVEHPDQDGLLFAGTADAGVYKTLNQAGVWAPTGEGLTDQRILGLAIDPIYPDVLYADTPTGLFRSANRGDRWERIGAPAAPPAARRVAVPEVAPPVLNTLVPLAGAAGRLLRLAGDGLHLMSGTDAADVKWLPVETPLAPRWVLVGPKGTPWLIGTGQEVYQADHPEQVERAWRALTLPADPSSSPLPGTIATLSVAAQGRLYQSPDRGETWVRVGALEGVSRLLTWEKTPGLLVAAMEDGAIMISHDGGAHWSPLQIPAPSPQGIDSVLWKARQ